jgi:two-component system NtrC family sensor kinase
MDAKKLASAPAALLAVPSGNPGAFLMAILALRTILRNMACLLRISSAKSNTRESLYIELLRTDRRAPHIFASLAWVPGLCEHGTTQEGRMPTMEASLLPVAHADLRPGRPDARGDRGVAAMNGESSLGVLLLRCAALSHREVREAVRRAGLSLSVELAENRREFLEELRRGSPSVIVAGRESIPDLDLREVFERARHSQPPIPVVLVGGNASQTESLSILRDGATEYLADGDLEYLPIGLARALRVRENSSAQVRVQVELDRAASMLRENQKLITVGRLAASIAHEINNPLEAVTNLLYLLGEEKDLPASARGYIALAQRELQRVGQISRQTLNFSRETTGPVRTHLDELMEEVLSLYGRRIAEKNIRVERQYDCHDEAIVYPGEMRQVLSNLVTNAIEASSLRGRLRIRVRCSRSWSDHGVRGVRISVGDNGSGIDPAVQRRLGEPFFTTKGQRGTGLGLWVTRSIIQRYGGEIQLRSSVAEARHGTVFSLFLPTNLRPIVVERNPGSGESGPGGTGSRHPVLDPTGTHGTRFDETAVGRNLSGETSLRRRASGE